MKFINDAGHGGIDPGAIYNGNIEKVYTLEAALYVNRRLNGLGFDSDVTRDRDETLMDKNRVNKVKQYNRCISHHFNAGGGSGVEVVHSIYVDGKFEHSLIDEFRNNGYPIRPKPVYFKKLKSGQDYYFMHRQTGNCRVTIVEYDFVDGPQSNKIKSKDYRVGMYECVVRAICKENNIKYTLNKKEENKNDISPWAEDAIKWAVKNNLTDGTNVKDDISLERFITILYRYDNLRTLD